MGLDADNQEVLSQQARDDQVRMISLVLNSSGLTPPLLTPFGDYFHNLVSTFHSDENVGEGILSSPQKNISEDTLPSSSPIVDVAAATARAQTEEGVIVTMASQETTESSSQRFVTETPQGTAGNVGATLHVASPPQVVMQHSDLGVWAVETDASKAKAHKGKGATTVTLDFDDSDDDVFDEEAENARASRLTDPQLM